MTTAPTDRSDGEGSPAAKRRPAGPVALVKHLRGEGFTVLDPTTAERVGSLGTGRQPHALAVHPTGRWGYVPYMASNAVEVLDLWTLSPVETVDRVGTAPVGATTTLGGRHLVVSSYGPLPGEDAPGVTVFDVDPATGRLAVAEQFPLGKTAGVAVDAAGDLWVALKEVDEVVRIAVAPGDGFEVCDRIPVDAGPQDLAYDPTSGLLGANCVDADAVTFLDVRERAAVASVPAPNPRGGTVVSRADRWFVADTEGDGLTAIDLAPSGDEGAAERIFGGPAGGVAPGGPGAVVGEDPDRVELDTPTAFVDVTPDGAFLVVDAYDDDRVTFLAPDDLSVVDRVRVGSAPHHPRFTADGRRCVVPCMEDDVITVLSTEPLYDGGRAEPIAEIPVPDGEAPSGCFLTNRRTQP